MRGTRWAALVAVALFGFSAAWADELTPGKKADIRQLLSMSGGDKLAGQFANAMTQSVVRQMLTSQPSKAAQLEKALPAEITAFLEAKFAAPGGFYDQFVGIYAQHYTHAEVKEILNWYASPTGSKALKIMPTLMQEGMGLADRVLKENEQELSAKMKGVLEREGLIPKGGDQPPVAAPAVPAVPGKAPATKLP
ncbi:MAG: DUF2059 domain-containing protein [Magnetococcales bacterium]|nr:DUF2059 domain-containing protein [Magnetococcales bacterium]